MKKFKQFIKESPLPPEIDKEEFRELTFSKLIAVFKKHFSAPIGNGSSRSVFRVKMNADDFNKDMKEDLGLDANYKGEVDSVFKVAKNAKGVVQNKKEVDIYRDARVLNYEQWLCPVIDCSKEILNLKDSEVENMDWEEGMMFVQAGKCDKIKSEKQIADILLKVFGANDKNGHIGYKFTLNNLAVMIADKIAYAEEIRKEIEDKGLVTEEQKDNLSNFVDMCRELGIGDLYQKSNWGLYKGDPVLLDYGFVKNSGEKIYWNSSYALDTMKDSSSGNIMYNIRKVNK